MLYIHTDIHPVIIYNQNNNKQTVTYIVNGKLDEGKLKDVIKEKKGQWNKHDYAIGCEAFMEVKIGQDRLKLV